MGDKDVVKAGPSRFEVMNQVEVGERGVQLATLAQIKTWAGEIAQSGLAPKGMDTEQKVMLAAQTGMELGFTPMRSLQAVVIVNGRATLMGEAALGLIRSSGQLEPGTQPIVGCRVTTQAEKDAGDGNLIGYCRTKRKGQADWVENTFSQGDAKLAHLWGGKDTWKKYPKRMLQARSVGFHMRDYWSDVGNGLLMADEAYDIPGNAPPERDVTPKSDIVTGRADPLVQALRGEPEEPESPEETLVDGEVIDGTWTDGEPIDEGFEEVPNLEFDEEPEAGEERPDWVNKNGEEVDPDTGEVIPDEFS